MRVGIIVLLVALVVLAGCVPNRDPSEIPEARPPEAATEPTEEKTLEPRIDQEILDELEEKEWVEVIVVLRDLSNITYEGAETYEDKMQIYRQKNVLGNQTVHAFISSLSGSEFIVDWTSLSGTGFGGEISKEGIEQMRKSPLVRRIYKPIIYDTI